MNILLREGLGIFLYTTMGMGSEWEYVHGNGRNEIEKVVSAHL